MKPTLLIDADTFVYQAATAHEFCVEWDPVHWSLWAELPPAIATFDRLVSEVKDKLGAGEVICALSDYTNPWRKEVLPTYKNNRKKTRKPVVYAPLREYVHETYKTFQRPGMEGDDILGIMSTMNPLAFTEATGCPAGRIIVSIDKDLKTVPGIHFNVDKDDAVRTIFTDQADRYHMLQTLTGDPTDGYRGLTGTSGGGAKKAEKALGEATTYQEMWPRVVEAYEKAGLTAEMALQTARVARICRAQDFDFENKKVKLWCPPA